jgi:hypothetical protein
MYCADTYQRVRRIARSEAKRMAAENAVSIGSGSPLEREPRWHEATRPAVVSDLVALVGRPNPAFAYWLVTRSGPQ